MWLLRAADESQSKSKTQEPGVFYLGSAAKIVPNQNSSFKKQLQSQRLDQKDALE
jgi:hypothetical protein